LRYWTDPRRGRLFAVDDVPCNKPPWGYLERQLVDAARDRGIDRDKLAHAAAIIHATLGAPLALTDGTTLPSLADAPRLAREVEFSFPLPAGLHAGPITYTLRPDGKQFLVVAPGGHIGLGSTLGDYIIAYTLP
jgi:quinoprotein glucose dehydrogenase